MGETARLNVRSLTTDDADFAAALDSKCFGKEACSHEYFLNAAQDEQREFLVAELDGKIIACAGAEITYDTAEIESLAVAPEYRRRGVAKILLAELLATLLKRGVTFILLEVRPSNTAAIKLYKKFNFQIVEREKNYYDDEDAWIMAKDFTDDTA